MPFACTDKINLENRELGCDLLGRNLGLFFGNGDALRIPFLLPFGG
jgi:hypothetical protein